jgi:hypothetical protein
VDKQHSDGGYNSYNYKKQNYYAKKEIRKSEYESSSIKSVSELFQVILNEKGPHGK